jgi:hypothetical protein
MGKLLEMNVSLGSKMVGPTVSSPHFTNAGDKNSSVCY